MAPATKRAAATKAKAPAAKVPRKIDPIREKVVVVQTALSDSDLPSNVVDMLVSLAPECLATAKDERHTSQENVVNMISQTLKGIQLKIQEDLSTAEATVGRSEEEKKTRDAACSAAETKLSERQASAASLKSALATDALDFKDKRSKLKEAETEQTDGDKEVEIAGADLQKLETAIQDIYEPLKETAATKAQVKQLQDIVGDFGFDQSLILALPGALSAAPPRNTFANVVMQQLENENSKHLTQLKEKLDAGAPARASRAAAVQTAQEEFKSAEKKQIESAAALKAAQEEERASASEFKAAKKFLDQLAPEVAKAEGQCKKHGARLQAFRSGPLQAFHELVERLAAPEPISAEEVVAEEERKEVAPTED